MSSSSIWGVQNRRIFVPVPPMEAFGVFINPYYFFLIGSGVVVAVGLWALLHRTRYGKIVRAAVHSREMVSALGIRIHAIYASVFALGVGIAAFRRRHLHARCCRWRSAATSTSSCNALPWW